MNKQKLKQFMESQGYEEISYKEWESRDRKGDIEVVFGTFDETICFKPKDKLQETEISNDLQERFRDKIRKEMTITDEERLHKYIKKYNELLKKYKKLYNDYLSLEKTSKYDKEMIRLMEETEELFRIEAIKKASSEKREQAGVENE